MRDTTVASATDGISTATADRGAFPGSVCVSTAGGDTIEAEHQPVSTAPARSPQSVRREVVSVTWSDSTAATAHRDTPRAELRTVVEFAVPAVPGRLPAGLTDASVVAIVPARYFSSRLPGKPLAEIHGHPMIEHVYRRAARAAVDAVIVATDDERIVTAVEGFGGIACLTRADHPSGTDRLAELAAQLPGDVFVNVQGDEPFIDPAAIDALVAPLILDRGEQMTTLCRPLSAEDDVTSPHLVKVVRDRRGRALYFSRAPIPYARTGDGAEPAVHIGVYAYRRSTLLALAALPPTPLERRESLEQLRALEHGIPIRVLETTYRSLSVDTPDDLAHARRTPADL